MRFISRQIVFREIPEEITLSYLIAGCQLRCKGCHSSDSWSVKSGEELSLSRFCKDIQKYRTSISCVLFMGGEWEPVSLIFRLKIAKACGLQTALYTGEAEIPQTIRLHLDYLKTGRYVAQLGGLDSPLTNQRLINLNTGICLNHYFQHETAKKGESNDKT